MDLIEDQVTIRILYIMSRICISPARRVKVITAFNGHGVLRSNSKLGCFYILHSANTLGEGINATIFTPATGK